MKEKTDTQPGLFGQVHSSRDYTKSKHWGKNEFNSSFPASLIAYMSSKGISPVYLCADKNHNITHKYISGEALFGIDPLSPNAFYNYEAGFPAFEKYYTGKREKIDLVMLDMETNSALSSLEIKLTAVPDNSTKSDAEGRYSCEIVFRPPTICFLACSICHHYNSRKDRERLQSILRVVPKINHWDEVESVAPHYAEIESAVFAVCSDMVRYQTPLIVQPIWKTQGSKMLLADECLDVFVWSNLAVVLMCAREKAHGSGISRFQRTIIWIYRMLFDFTIYGQFDYMRIRKSHAYSYANDKAFAISGKRTYPILKSDELAHPRIGKNEIKNIILGGGQNLLSPERRFDAVLVNSPGLFD